MPPLGNLGSLVAADLRPVHLHPPTRRFWHVYRHDGGIEKLVAHKCKISGGALSFYNYTDPDDLVLIRALGRGAWDEVTLVDTPYASPVHMPPDESLRDARRT